MNSIETTQTETMIYFRNRGFSLIEMMVAISISSIVALSFATLFSDSARQTHIVRQQLEIMDIQREVSQALSNTKVCGASFKNIVVSGNGSFPVNSVFLGVDAAGNGLAPIIYKGMPQLSTQLKFDEMNIIDVAAVPGVPNSYTAKLAISFDSPVGPPMHAQIPLMLQTDVTGTVTGCGGGNSAQNMQVGYTDVIPQGGNCTADPLPNTPRYFYTCNNQPAGCQIFNSGGGGGGGKGGGGFPFPMFNFANSYLNGLIPNPAAATCPNGPDMAKCNKIDVTPPNNPVTNWVKAPMGYLGPGRSCISFVGRGQSTYRYNSTGCYYDPATGWIYACSGDTSIRCGYVCTN